MTRGAEIIAAVAGVDENDPAGERTAALTESLLLAPVGGGTAGDGPPQHVERAKRFRADRSVRGQADVALELADRNIGLPAEYAVAAAGVEAHVQEPLLEQRDVVADVGMARDERQQPVTQLPVRFIQRAVGLDADNAVDPQPAPLLERAHRMIDGVVE